MELVVDISSIWNFKSIGSFLAEIVQVTDILIKQMLLFFLRQIIFLLSRQSGIRIQLCFEYITDVWHEITLPKQRPKNCPRKILGPTTPDFLPMNWSRNFSNTARNFFE